MRKALQSQIHTYALKASTAKRALPWLHLALMACGRPAPAPAHSMIAFLVREANGASSRPCTTIEPQTASLHGRPTSQISHSMSFQVVRLPMTVMVFAPQMHFQLHAPLLASSTSVTTTDLVTMDTFVTKVPLSPTQLMVSKVRDAQSAITVRQECCFPSLAHLATIRTLRERPSVRLAQQPCSARLSA